MPYALSMGHNELLKILGERIRTLRKAKSLSQERLAELAALHPTYISDIERGKVNASILTFEAVAGGLGLSLAELVAIGGSPEDVDFENSLTAMLNRVRSLDPKKRAAFIEASENLFFCIEKL
jgi:transcriptional regulator with XRE-family HTH domain